MPLAYTKPNSPRGTHLLQFRSQSKMNLYIPLEVKNRELYAKIFLAKHAAERGFNVILGRKNDLNNLISKMPPGVYLGIGAFENFKKFYAKLKQQGFTVCINEEEGLVTYTDKMYVDMRVSKEALAHIDEVFTWGAENQKILTQAFPDSANKFKVTGSPRFDLLKRCNQKVYATEMEEITNKYGKYLLICTSFSSINHFNKDLDYLNSLIEKKTLRSDESIENFNRYKEIKRKTFDAFLAAIPRLAAINDATNIVIRPHPSENMDVYRRFAEKFPNVHVDARFSVHPWIIRADALVHHYCTTSIEALATDTPRFALRPIRDPLSEKEIPFECSVECASVEELSSKIKEHLTTGKGNGDSKSLIQDYSRYVWNIGEPLAAEAIVDRISAVTSASGNRSTDYGKVLMAKAFYIAKKVLRSALRRNRGDLNYLDHKFSHLSLSEVDSVLRAFESESTPLKCRRFAGDFVHICR